MNWREASTLILAAANSSLVKTKWDYKILGLKRTDTSSFMPSAYVFPGGVTHKIDYDEKWEGYLSQFNLKCNDSQSLKAVPSILNEKAEGKLSKLISLKITAIRETFEETGILLCNFKNKHSDEKWTTTTSENLKEWRTKVQNDPLEFFNLCQFYQCCPDIENLHIWSNWLTPNDKKKRFDTAFFISFLENQPVAAADEIEIQSLSWFAPDELIKMHNGKKIWLPTPQFYELYKLLQFKNINLLKKFANNRSIQGCERWMPQRIKAVNGLISVLPGDDAYKKNVDFSLFEETNTISVTMEEFREKFEVLHRIEFLNKFHAKLIIKNYKPCYGHVIPFLCENID